VQSIVLGMIAVIVGVLVAAYGARGFFVLLPFFGFVVGFELGGQVMASLFGEGMFATVLGWTLGFVVGLLFAVLAGLWWWAAVVILMGVVGYEIGSGLLIAIGLDPGLLTAAAGLAVAVVLAIAAIILDAPTLLVAAVTAFGGAAYAVAGFYLMFGQITVTELKEGPLGALEGKWVALIVWLGLGVIAFGFQWLDTRRIGYERIERGRYRYS
jgi:hypothetical protein